MKIIIGLDPGSHKLGFGVIELGEKLRTLSYGVIQVPTSLSFSEKLVYLQDALRKLFKTHQPEVVVVEKIFFGKNADSAFKLGHVRGICLAEVARCHSSLKEYAARKIKKLVTGHGGATKAHVQLVVRETLGIREEIPEDASDALSMALGSIYCEQTEKVIQRAVEGRRLM